MFKKLVSSIAVLATVGLAQTPADETDLPVPQFPDIDSGNHRGAHCRIYVSYPGRRCGRLWNRFNDIVKGFSNEDPGEGTYDNQKHSIFSKSWITATRTEKVRRGENPKSAETEYVQWYFTQIGNDCHVRGESAQIEGRRETEDFGGNHHFHKENAFCAVWDVLKYSDVFTTQYTSSCSFVPENPDHDCVHYPKPWRPSYAPIGDHSWDETEDEFLQ